MTQDGSPADEVDRIFGALTNDEVATFGWLMNEARRRFGASDRFDPNDPAFEELAKQLVSKVL